MPEESPPEGPPPAPDLPSEAAVGLCFACRHRRLQTSERSVFIRCARAAKDPTYPRYPRLPVIVCPGFERER